MPGPIDKKKGADAVSSFFGDDDDWMDDDSDVEPAPPPVVVEEPAVEVVSASPPALVAAPPVPDAAAVEDAASSVADAASSSAESIAPAQDWTASTEEHAAAAVEAPVESPPVVAPFAPPIAPPITPPIAPAAAPVMADAGWIPPAPPPPAPPPPSAPSAAPLPPPPAFLPPPFGGMLGAPPPDGRVAASAGAAGAPVVPAPVGPADAAVAGVAADASSGPAASALSVDGDSKMSAGEAGAPNRAGAVSALASEGRARGALDLLVSAARAAWVWCGDAAGADTLLREAGSTAPEALRWKAVVAEARGDRSGAAVAWETLASVSTGQSASEAWRRAASFSAVVGADGEAAERAMGMLLHAVEADATDLVAWRMLADRAMASDRPADADRADEALAAQLDGPSACEVLQQLAARQRAAGKVAEAIGSLRAARDADPGASSARVELEDLAVVAGDHQARAEIAAARAAESDGADAAWWWTQAARAQRTLNDVDGAAASYSLAVAAGSRVASWEQQGWLLSVGRSTDLAEAAAAAAELEGDGPDAEAAWTWAALCREVGLRDPAGAVDAWRRAGAGGAAEAGFNRCMRAAGRAEELGAWLVARAEDSVGIKLTLAETLERQDPRSTSAAALYAALSESADADRRVLEGSLRLARRTDDAHLLVRALERLADRAPSRDRRSGLQLEAAMVRRYRLGDASGATALLMSGAPPASSSRELQVGLMVEGGQNVQAAALLEGEAAAAPPEDAADLLYRAALLRWVAAEGDVGDGAAEVVALLDRALALNPGHSDAGVLLSNAAGADRPELIAAAGGAVAAGVAMLSGETPELSAGPLAAIHAARVGDVGAWSSLVGRSGEPGAAVWRAELAAGASEVVSLLAGADTAGAPWAAAVGLAHRAGAHREAARFAAAGGDAGLRDLVWQLRLAGADGFEDAVDRLAVGQPAAAAHEAAVAARSEGGARRAEAEETLARSAQGDPARAMHARAAALAWREAGDPGRALAAWDLVREARPAGREAWDAMVDAARAVGEGDLIVSLGERGAPVDADELARCRAELLLVTGQPGAVDAWALACTSGALFDQLGWEVALGELGAWSELFSALTQRAGSTTSGDERARIESLRRWILAEKLAETEEAWTLYQLLHGEDPSDRDVTERLARIAGARGETDLAVGYLTELAESAPGAADAARCHRRIAEAWLAVGDDAYASQAYYNALDAQPDDVAALGGLRGIALRAEDWGTLLSVMKRQASLVSGADRASALREVAELTEAHVGSPGAAVDAWRTAAEADPEDLTAWRRVLDLAEHSGEHEAFLEAAGGVEPRMDGAERSLVLRRMGGACEALGRSEDAVHYYEQAVAAEVPDLDAAGRLEALYRETYDWSGVSRALAVQARFASDSELRMAAWLEAARIEREQRHDREAASRLYEEALSVDPHCFPALWFQCIWLFESGRSGEALPLFAAVEPRLAEELEAGGEDAPIAVASFLYRYAELLRGSGREEEALQRYLGALEHVPVHLPSLEAAGPLLVDRREWEKASEVWRTLLQITGGVGDPQKRAQVHTMLGLVDQAQGRSEQAFKRFTRALEAFPNHVPALRGLAAELESREDWNALLSVYNAVIYHATAPQDVIDAYMIKGRVLDEQMGRPDKAVQHYERSLAFEGRQPVACLRLAELALRRGAWDDALSYAARGVDIATELPSTLAELHVARGLALSGLDEYAGATQALALAREANPALELGDDPLRDPAVAIAALRARLPR